MVPGPVGLCRILDKSQSVLGRQLTDRLEVSGLAVQVDGQDRLGAVADRLRDPGRIDVARGGIGFDVNVKDNKASGSGTRTIYPVEMPHCMAKTRSLKESFEYVDGSDDLWQQLKMTSASN